jgi:hypothetical protein
MEAEQEAPETTQQELEASVENPPQETQTESEEPSDLSIPAVQKQEQEKAENSTLTDHGVDRSHFVHGLAAGLGIGCIATFVIMWIAVFFSPQLPSRVTYEAMLAVFIYPLIYLLAVGLVALTAGIVREYFSISR